MDGLECSEVPFSKINLGDRMDSDFFTKSYLNIEERMGNVFSKKIGDLAEVTASAFYPAATQLYAIGDTPFARCVDCIHYPVITVGQDKRFEKIPYEFAAGNKGISVLTKGDLIITKVGTPCYASIINDYERIALSRTVLGLTNFRGVNPYYLMIFLRCKYGFQQLYRQRELTIQYQLTLPRVKDVDVFLPGKEFQEKIQDICNLYTDMQAESDGLYTKAEHMLLSALNFDKTAFSKANTVSKNFSQTFGRTGRLDAEYYQPKYDDLTALLNNFPTKPLGAIVKITKSIEPGSEYYGTEGIPFIRVSDVSTMGINTPTIRIPKTTVPSIETLYPQKDTILFSKDGSVGIAYKIEESMKAVTSGALLHLRVRDNGKILPDYLMLVLNSDIVQLQAEKDASGAIIQHWKPGDIEKVTIPILPYEMQKKIAESVQASFFLRRKAEAMIKLAVRAVEIAIEDGETAAVVWLNRSEALSVKQTKQRKK